MHHRIVIIGGGNAGLSVAARLRNAGQDDVAVVEPQTEHFYQPLWTLVGGGAADRSESVRPQAEVMPQGVAWIKDAVTQIHPDERRLTLASEAEVDYDAGDWFASAGLTIPRGRNVDGGGLGSIATFMQRTLTPSEFDILSARLFGSIANSDSAYLPLAIPLCVLACIAIFASSGRLNVLALGRDTTSNLGLNHRFEMMKILFFVSILMAVSVSMIGPMVFLGFLVAMLAYQFSDTYDHKYILPMAALIAFTILGGAYFIMKNIFYAQGVVSIIVEVVGGVTFLIVIMRKGRL